MAILWLCLLFPIHSQAQTLCRTYFDTSKDTICAGESVELTARIGDSLKTTFKADNSQRGNMFTVIAKEDIIITHFDGHPAADTKYAIYYKKGTYVGYERDSLKWTLLGRNYNVKANRPGSPTRIPIYFNVRVNKGDSVSFYVTSTTLVVQNYLNGQYQYRIFSEDNYLQFKEGVGLDWPFTDTAITGIFVPRVWNGNIYYHEPFRAKYEWFNTDTNQTIKVTPQKRKQNYELKAVYGNCTTTAVQTIYIDTIDLDLGPDTTICQGQSVYLNPDVPTKNNYTFKWKPGGAVSKTKSVNTSGEKTVTITSDYKCLFKDTINITVRPIPIFSLGADKNLCVGDSLVLDPGDFGSLARYNWNTSDTTQFITVTRTGNYNVVVNDSFGCKNKSKVELTFNDLPKVELGKAIEKCAGDSILFTPGTTKLGLKYLWNGIDTNKTIWAKTSGTYSIEVTDSHGCSSKDTTTLLIHDLPMANFTDSHEVCKDESVLLDAGFHGPKSEYFWPKTSSTSQQKFVSINGWHSVRITDSFGCIGWDSSFLNVRKLPNVNLGNDFFLCENIDTLLDAGFDDGYSTYSWSTNEITRTIKVQATGLYKVVVTDSFGCSKSDKVNITVLPNPEIINFEDDSICAGETITLNPGNHTAYLWSTKETSPTIDVGEGTYGVIVKNDQDCQSEATITITELAQPISAFQSEEIGGQSVEFTNNSTDATNYTWDFGDGQSSSQKSPTHWYKNASTYTATLKVSNKCGDHSSQTELTVKPSSLSTMDDSPWSLYPNPNSGTFFIQTKEEVSLTEIDLYTISGQKIQLSIVRVSKDLIQVKATHPLPKGMYLLHTTVGDAQLTQPVFIR